MTEINHHTIYSYHFYLFYHPTFSKIGSTMLQKISRLHVIRCLAILPLFAICMAACKKDAVVAAAKTIAVQLAADTDYSLLSAAIVKAGLTDALTKGTLTIFAPNNAAFAASGIDKAFIDKAVATDLATLLKYHVLDTKIDAAGIPAAANTAKATLDGKNLFITKVGDKVSINGVLVTKADGAAGNGVIHQIGRLLTPPSGTVIQAAQANANLSYLVAAILKCKLETAFGAENITAFAPVNAAFIEAGYKTILEIQNLDAAKTTALSNILQYHIVNARAFATNLTNSQQITMANKGTVKVGIEATGAVAVQGNGNGVKFANATTLNSIATNGVIHIIDRVLLP
jgi:uncharacterized surface protein with fasciclin (FAS1) repeats